MQRMMNAIPNPNPNPPSNSPCYAPRVKERLKYQVDVTYDLDPIGPNYQANLMCYNLARSAIDKFSDDQDIGFHSQRQIAMFLTSLEQGKDALARAYLLVDK
jgi:hypothetical protein